MPVIFRAIISKRLFVSSSKVLANKMICALREKVGIIVAKSFLPFSRLALPAAKSLISRGGRVMRQGKPPRLLKLTERTPTADTSCGVRDESFEIHCLFD